MTGRDESGRYRNGGGVFERWRRGSGDVAARGRPRARGTVEIASGREGHGFGRVSAVSHIFMARKAHEE